MHKGTNIKEKTFCIWKNKFEAGLYCRVSTTNKASKFIEGIYATPDIKLKVWVHITLMKKGDYLMFYQNGKKLLEMKLKGKVVSNTGPLYIGKSCNYNGFFGCLDLIQIHNRALLDKEIARAS